LYDARRRIALMGVDCTLQASRGSAQI